MLLLAFIATWLRPSAIAQSVTPQDAQIKQEVDAQLATKGLTKTDDEQVGQRKVNATDSTSHFNIQAQSACETEIRKIQRDQRAVDQYADQRRARPAGDP